MYIMKTMYYLHPRMEPINFMQCSPIYDWVQVPLIELPIHFYSSFEQITLKKKIVNN